VDSDAVFNFLLHCRKIETMSKSSGGPFNLFLDRDESEEVDCNSVAVDRYIVSFDLIDCCCV